MIHSIFVSASGFIPGHLVWTCAGTLPPAGKLIHKLNFLHMTIVVSVSYHCIYPKLPVKSV